MAADELRPAEEEHRQQDGEQRLGRHERADDRDARAVEGLEEERVRGAPEQAGEDERRAFAADVREARGVRRATTSTTKISTVPQRIVAVAASCGATVLSAAMCRTTLSRVAKSTVQPNA